MTPGAAQQPDTRSQLLADGALVLITLIWGSTFVLVKDVTEQVPPLLLLAMRFTMAAAALAPVIVLMRRWRGLSWQELLWGTVLGLALYAGYAFQTIGLQWTTATNAGFITGLYVAIVPALGIPLLRQMPNRPAWAGVVLAVAGLALLTLRDGGLNFYEGDPVVLGCTLAFAVHVVLVAKVARRFDAMRLTLVQLLVTGALSAVTSMGFETAPPVISAEVWAGAAFLGVVASALAITVQVSVQGFTSVVHAALIFALEPVFAAIFGIWLQGDRLPPLGWLGAGLILAGTLLAELGPYILRRVRARGAALALQRMPAPQARTELAPDGGINDTAFVVREGP